MSGLNSMYVTGLELEDYFVSNQNGLPLAGGVVTFYEDQSRTTLKLVYELSYNSMTNAYSYVALPNPMTLSGVGTFQDAAGDNIAVYYYPYDTFGNSQLYYITVYDQYGNFQFDREAWPYPLGVGGGNASANAVGITNQLTNPTFAQVNFVPLSTLTITIAGSGTTTVPIAPDWTLVIVATGAGSVTVTQTAKAGQLAIQNNPPYTLDFVISSNISSCNLIQTLYQNPDWAAPQTTGVMGYLSGSILLGNNTSVAMQYAISSNIGSPQTIGMWTNTTGAYAQFNNTVQLAAANNTGSAPAAYDQIIVAILNLPGSASISNVQVVPLTSNISGVAYDQTPVNRQFDHMFNYYNPLIQFMPNPSYLVGWDFALNPAQFLTTNVAAFNTGANTSNYVWDNTIVFQSTTNSFTTSKGTSGALRLTTTANTKLAVIQYIPAPQASAILFEYMCCMVEDVTNQTGGFPATVSLWITEGSLPSIAGTTQSFVKGLDANGHPNSVVTGWTEVPRSGFPSSGGSVSLLGNATYTVQTPGNSLSLGPSFNYTPFNGWAEDGTHANAATYMAIVVGTGTITSGNNWSIQSISLQSGSIPTIPAPKSQNTVLADCQLYYESSFNIGTAPAQNNGANTGEFICSQTLAATTASQVVGYITYKTTKWAPPSAVTLYNPAAANAHVRNETRSNDCSSESVTNNNNDGFFISATTSSGSAVGDVLGVHWAADSRLGA